MDEQPVALAMINRSPNICVSNFTYDVSPQPEHAPENSMSGSMNCVPLSSIGNFVRSGAGRLRKNLKLSRSVARNGSIGTMLIALCVGVSFDFAGQIATHKLHPVL